MKHIVNHYNVEKIQLINLNIYNFKHLKQIYFLLI